jgi:signal transduction histidine kinase
MTPETIKLFDSVTSSASRMQKLIEALLSYSQINIGNSDFADTDLSVLLETVKSNISELLDEKSAVVQAKDLPVLNVIPYQFNQLFTNLISNAVKYSKAAVAPLINVSYELVSSSEIVTESVPPEAMYHKITFADNGIGFDQIYHLKIFELFQRLNKAEEYPGTGIGLAICSKIVTNHKGYMSANGQLGKGSVFNIYLPAN